MNTTRLAAWLAGLWAGVLLGIGLIGAPAGFTAGAGEWAGRIAGRMFAAEAYLSLGVAVVLFLVLRARARRAAETGTGSVFSTDMLLVLGALFCTVAGYFALQPMMAAARAGQGGCARSRRFVPAPAWSRSPARPRTPRRRSSRPIRS